MKNFEKMPKNTLNITVSEEYQPSFSSKTKIVLLQEKVLEEKISVLQAKLVRLEHEILRLKQQEKMLDVLNDIESERVGLMADDIKARIDKYHHEAIELNKEMDAQKFDLAAAMKGKYSVEDKIAAAKELHKKSRKGIVCMPKEWIKL